MTLYQLQNLHRVERKSQVIGQFVQEAIMGCFKILLPFLSRKMLVEATDVRRKIGLWRHTTSFCCVNVCLRMFWCVWTVTTVAYLKDFQAIVKQKKNGPQRDIYSTRVQCTALKYIITLGCQLIRKPSFINLLKPTGYVMHHQFNIQQLYVLPTLYSCVLYLSENKQRLVPFIS